jgi:GNAT superfamily N-acetyltransferase
MAEERTGSTPVFITPNSTSELCAMQIVLRPALIQDFDFCKNLYFARMEEVIRELNLDRGAQGIAFRQQWSFKQTRIITARGAIFLAELFIEGSFQRHGIGAAVIRRLIDEAAAEDIDTQCRQNQSRGQDL